MTKTVLILGANGGFGGNAAEAFWNAVFSLSGMSIQVAGLFLLGAIWALLHRKEMEPLKVSAPTIV